MKVYSIIFIFGLIAMAGFEECGRLAERSGEAHYGFWLFLGDGALIALGLLSYFVGIKTGREPVRFEVLPAGKYEVIGGVSHRYPSFQYLSILLRENGVVCFVVGAPLNYVPGTEFVLKRDGWWGEPYLTYVKEPLPAKREQC